MTTPSGGDVPSSSQEEPGETSQDEANEHEVTGVISAYPQHIGASMHNIPGRQNRKHGHKHTPGE